MRILSALVVVLLLAGCESHAQVAALQADTMGSWSRPGLRQLRGFVTDDGSSLGKPRYAQVYRILEVQDGSDISSVLTGVREAAEDAGWSVTYEHADGSFSAEKPFSVDGEELRGEFSAGRQDIGRVSRGKEIYISLTAYPG